MAAIPLVGIALAMSLSACAGDPTLPQQPAAPGAAQAGQGGGNQGGGGGGGGGGTPCWVGDWLSQDTTFTLQLGNGITAPLEGGANVHLTMQQNGVMRQDFSHSGAMNGYETAPGLGRTAMSAQFFGSELDQVTGDGDTSGTLTVKIEVPGHFTLVSGDQTTTQDDEVGSVTTMQFTCSATQLVTTTDNGKSTYLRVNS